MRERSTVRALAEDVLHQLRATPAARVTEMEVVVDAGVPLREGVLRHDFEAMSRGTPLEGARLRLHWEAARYLCLDCLAAFQSVESLDEVSCPQCGGMALPTRPPGLARLRSIELEIA